MTSEGDPYAGEIAAEAVSGRMGPRRADDATGEVEGYPQYGKVDR